MSSLSHAQARSILRAAFSRAVGRAASETELTMAQAVALLETGYGRIGQFAAWADQGMFNWGALQKTPNADGTCPVGTQPGMDASNARCFYVYPDDPTAAAAFLNILIGSQVSTAIRARNQATLEALSTGSPLAVAEAMRTPMAYYEADVNQYANAIQNAVAAIAASGAGTMPAPKSSGIWAGVVMGVGGVLAAGAAYLFSNGRR